MHCDCQSCTPPFEHGYLGDFVFQRIHLARRGEKLFDLRIFGNPHLGAKRRCDEFASDKDYHTNLAACRSYTRCNHLGRPEAGTEGLPE
jgi:hypothetical protein